MSNTYNETSVAYILLCKKYASAEIVYVFIYTHDHIDTYFHVMLNLDQIYNCVFMHDGRNIVYRIKYLILYSFVDFD